MAWAAPDVALAELSAVTSTPGGLAAGAADGAALGLALGDALGDAEASGEATGGELGAGAGDGLALADAVMVVTKVFEPFWAVAVAPPESACAPPLLATFTWTPSVTVLPVEPSPCWRLLACCVLTVLVATMPCAVAAPVVAAAEPCTVTLAPALAEGAGEAIAAALAEALALAGLVAGAALELGWAEAAADALGGAELAGEAEALVLELGAAEALAELLAVGAALAPAAVPVMVPPETLVPFELDVAPPEVVVVLGAGGGGLAGIGWIDTTGGGEEVVAVDVLPVDAVPSAQTGATCSPRRMAAATGRRTKGKRFTGAGASPSGW